MIIKRCFGINKEADHYQRKSKWIKIRIKQNKTKTFLIKKTAKNKQTKKKPVCNNQNEKCILGHYCQNGNLIPVSNKTFCRLTDISWTWGHIWPPIDLQCFLNVTEEWRFPVLVGFRTIVLSTCWWHHEIHQKCPKTLNNNNKK